VGSWGGGAGGGVPLFRGMRERLGVSYERVESK
jgi:hypothetical protein